MNEENYSLFLNINNNDPLNVWERAGVRVTEVFIPTVERIPAKVRKELDGWLLNEGVFRVNHRNLR